MTDKPKKDPLQKRSLPRIGGVRSIIRDVVDVDRLSPSSGNPFDHISIRRDNTKKSDNKSS